MTVYERLDRLFEQNNGILKTAQVLENGIAKSTFYAYVRLRGAEQAAHGVYVSPDAWTDAMYLLHLRCAQVVFSHESALFFHDLTDREPSPYSITVRTGYNPAALQADGIRVYTIKKELHGVGIVTLSTPFGNPVPVYDMERTVCDLIRNLSKNKSADAQILMRNYMMERFLERVSLSEYRNKFILKGGMLVAAMVGLDARSTMDIDATVKGATVGIEEVASMIDSIISVPVDDGAAFRVKRISEIMDEAEYPGIRVSMETEFDGVITPLKIDISTGDAITPREVRYRFKLMLEERSIEIWAYNLETVLAEKLETVVTRATTNTRMRDFYDLHILSQLHGRNIIPADFRAALIATAGNRGTERSLTDAPAAFDEVEADPNMEALWRAYQKKFSYAADLSWHTVMESIRSLYRMAQE